MQWLFVVIAPAIWIFAMVFAIKFCNDCSVNRSMGADIVHRLGCGFVLMVVGYGATVGTVCQIGASLFGDYQTLLVYWPTAVLVWGATGVGLLLPWIALFIWPPKESEVAALQPSDHDEVDSA